jgi:hypothetical protein
MAGQRKGSGRPAHNSGRTSTGDFHIGCDLHIGCDVDIGREHIGREHIGREHIGRDHIGRDHIGCNLPVEWVNADKRRADRHDADRRRLAASPVADNGQPTRGHDADGRRSACRRRSHDRY